MRQATRMTPARWSRDVGTYTAIAAGAIVLRVAAGVGFVNYDTLYGLAWGGQLSRGATPTYDVALAPTPHPLIEWLGLVSVPLGAHTAVKVTVALAFIALSTCGWVIYRLGAIWFNPLAGVLAALIFLTRVPVLSYGVRAYIDLPYLVLVLGAILVESRRSRAGTPVLALLALAGLLRPEAWAFSGLYVVYLMNWLPRWLSVRLARGGQAQCRHPTELAVVVRLLALAATAPLMWVVSDLIITGQPLWSLTHTQSTAAMLDRVSGIANVPEYIPRRIGEILRPPALVVAALGGVLSLMWLRRQAAMAAIVGTVAVVVFAALASIGLPINTRYAFLPSAILCVFCGAGVFGWLELPTAGAPGHKRTVWISAATVAALALIGSGPSQYKHAHTELGKLARTHVIEDELVALVDDHAINLKCGRVAVPDHAPLPLLALYLKTSPANVVSLQSGNISAGLYVDPASKAVEEDYALNERDPIHAVGIPPGFAESRANASWIIFKRCS
jgi:hypothetical protein